MRFDGGTFHLLALIITLTVEGVGMALWARYLPVSMGRALTACLLANLVVHSLFWFAQPILLTDWPRGLFLAEGIVVLGEGAVYARGLRLNGWRPWLVALTLNAASLVIGLYLWPFLLLHPRV